MSCFLFSFIQHYIVLTHVYNISPFFHRFGEPYGPICTLASSKDGHLENKAHTVEIDEYLEKEKERYNNQVKNLFWHLSLTPLSLIQGFQSGPVPGTFTRPRLCIVSAEITEPPQNQRWSKPQVRQSIGLWNIFHKKLMITSIAEFSHSNRTTASRPS